MKTKYLILLSVLTLTSLHAEDLTTRDGKVYHDYKVLGHDAGYLTILYSDGGGKIPLSNLSDDMQKKYGYNKGQADAFVQASTQADRQAKAAIAEERRAEAQRKAAAAAAAAANAPAPVQVAIVAPAQAPAAVAGASASTKPPALTKDEIAEIKSKIRDLQEDIDFMSKQEAKVNGGVSPLGSTGITDGGTSSVSTGAYGAKITEESEQLSDLKQQLQTDRNNYPPHF